MEKQKKKRLHGKTLWFFLLAPLMFFSGVAQSEFPESPVTLIAAMAVGGPTDLSARAIAIGASSYLKQSIVVDNKAGGGELLPCL
jgi:tripartite-type tricarboxylate transporter receptor subunit TctC